MQKTILRLLWPYVLRYLAKHSAAYLDKRREQKRRLKEAGVAGAEEIASTISSPGVASVECPPPRTRLSPTTAVWYVLAGVLLGSAIGLMLAKLWQEEN